MALDQQDPQEFLRISFNAWVLSVVYHLLIIKSSENFHQSEVLEAQDILNNIRDEIKNDKIKSDLFNYIESQINDPKVEINLENAKDYFRENIAFAILAVINKRERRANQDRVSDIDAFEMYFRDEDILPRLNTYEEFDLVYNSLTSTNGNKELLGAPQVLEYLQATRDFKSDAHPNSIISKLINFIEELKLFIDDNHNTRSWYEMSKIVGAEDSNGLLLSKRSASLFDEEFKMVRNDAIYWRKFLFALIAPENIRTTVIARVCSANLDSLPGDLLSQKHEKTMIILKAAINMFLKTLTPSKADES